MGKIAFTKKQNDLIRVMKQDKLRRVNIFNNMGVVGGYTSKRISVPYVRENTPDT